jgi:transcriptional regulator with XRE-family HTH domain
MPYKLQPTDHPDNRAGIRVRPIRRAAGVTMTTLAAELHALGLLRYGKAPRLVALEHGQTLLSREEAELIARVLGTTPEVIMAGTDDEELERLKAELAGIVAEGREHRRQLRPLEDKLRETGALTKAERSRYDKHAAAVSWARSQAALYRSKIDYIENDEL